MHGTLGQVAETATIEVEKKPELPTFKPRWWYKAGRLDARPAIWSLKNRPEEWQPHGSGRYFIEHIPSKHVFQIVYTPCLYDAKCSCNSNGGRFQMFHARAFKRAVQAWYAPQIAAQQAATQKQFMEHFIR